MLNSIELLYEVRSNKEFWELFDKQLNREHDQNQELNRLNND